MEVTSNMKEESGVLRGSGMLRPSSGDKDDKTEASEKNTEEIDVEGNSEDEVKDSDEDEDKVEDEDEDEIEVDVEDNEEVKDEVKNGRSASQEPQRLEEKPEEGDRDGPLKEVDIVGNSRAGSTDVHSESASPSNQQPEKQVCNPVREVKRDALQKKIESGQNLGTEASKTKTEQDQVIQVPASKTSEFSEKEPGSSLGETLKTRGDQQAVVFKTDTDVKADQGVSTVPQAKEKIAGLEAKQAAKPQRPRTFEDAFKASLGKLNIEVSRRLIKTPESTLKPVDSASQRPVIESQLHCPKDSERVTSLADEGQNVMAPEKTERGPSSHSRLENIPGGRSGSSLNLTGNQKPARDDQTIEDDTSDDEADSSRDIDNFSSDSSSTIIDIEMATKESTEEEILRKLSQPGTTSLQSQDSKVVLKEEAARAKTRESNPTSDTKSGGKVSGSRSDLPSRYATRTIQRRTHRMIIPPREADKRQQKGALGDAHPAKRQQLPRMSAAKQRERSKSDESQHVLGKKYRISKHGIILQTGVKLEAMDYSKKWYLARIVSVDESDNTVLIHFDGWNSRFDEWLEFDSDRLRPLARVSSRRETAKEVKALGGYKVGDEVLARWSDCRYYPAKILGIKTNGSYRVLFYDGIEKIVMGINVRDMPDSLKSQQFFSNLEHQFRALLNKKRRGSNDVEESTSGSRPSSPVQQPQKRRHPSATQTPQATQPAKRSRQDSGKTPRGLKGYVITTEPVPPSPTLPQDLMDLLPSPTTSEASELMSALEQGMLGNKKRYREPLIFDKTSGLIRDPRRMVAPKELIIDLDHNKYKCEVPDCGKAFRKASLLEYHDKYYHINKPASSTCTSAITAAKNALTRSRKRLSTSAMTPGSSKMRRTESLDVSPAKITSRPMRASAPSILTTIYKRPLPSPKLETPGEAAQPLPPPTKIPMSSQFIKKQPETLVKKTLPTELLAAKPNLAPPPPVQMLAVPKTQGSEVTAKVAERSRRISGSLVGKEDKPSKKWEVLTTTIVEKPDTPAKTAAPTPEVKIIKTEPDVALPSQKPETKVAESCATTNKNAEVKGQIEAVPEVAGVEKAEVPKKGRRNKPHKKHKRHKSTRGRDRRTREQSRSERRRTAERAKQRRLEQRRLKDQFEASAAAAAAAQKPEDATGWTAKYMPATIEKKLPQSPAQSSDDPTAKPEAVDSSTTEDGGPRDMISCVCRNPEEEGFMIQCEACFGWQHGGCVGLTEHTIPKQYICSFCIYPENLRTHARHRYDQDWFRTGRLPTLTEPAQPKEESSDLTVSMLKTHQLMADMINVTEALDGLQRKLEILKSENHPDLKLWSHHWGLNDESTPLDDSAHSRQLQTSLEESDLHQTSAETSALAESMRSEVVIDSIAAEEVVTDIPDDPCMGISDAKVGSGNFAVGNRPDGGEACRMGRPPEGDRPEDKQNASGLIPDPRNRNPQDFGLDSLNIEVSLIEIDSDKPLGKSLPTQATKSESERNVRPGGDVPLAPDKNAPLSLKSQNSQTVSAPTGKPATHFVLNLEPSTTQEAKGGVTTEGREPGTQVHDGKLDCGAKGVLQKDTHDLPKTTPALDSIGIPIHTAGKKGLVTGVQGEPCAPKHDGKNGNSSDDEPLIKYSRKGATSSETESESTPAAVKTTALAPSLPHPTPTAVSVTVNTAPPGGQAVPAGICKLNLFNHIVCVEEELKRRMDFVEEQIEALELAFNQSAGSKNTPYVPPDPLQMKRTISTLIDDLERVNKLVSI